jgi:hypothetical protein
MRLADNFVRQKVYFPWRHNPWTCQKSAHEDSAFPCAATINHGDAIFDDDICMMSGVATRHGVVTNA